MTKKTWDKQPKPVTWNDNEYESINAAARAVGIATSTMKYRLDQGYTCDDDLPEQAEWLRTPCEWNGVQYDSISEAARAEGLIVATMYDRIARCGYTSDDDLTKAPPAKWNGVQYSSVREAAEALGMSYQAMYYRLNRGYTCDDDMERPPKN